MRFCFQLGIIGVCGAAALHAAGSIQVPSRTVPAVTAKVIPVVRTDPRTGQSVKTIVVTPRVIQSRLIPAWTDDSDESAHGTTMQNSDVRTLVEETATQYEVSPALVDSVIQVESNYNPHAVSPKGAQGLMQLMPATARRFGVKNTFDPKDNIEGGVRYLKFLQETFKDERLAVAAYNAGEGAVQKYGNVPPYAETMSYVAKVGKKYGQARRARTAQQAARQAPSSKPEHPPLAQFIDSEGRLHITTQ